MRGLRERVTLQDGKPCDGSTPGARLVASPTGRAVRFHQERGSGARDPGGLYGQIHGGIESVISERNLTKMVLILQSYLGLLSQPVRLNYIEGIKDLSCLL